MYPTTNSGNGGNSGSTYKSTPWDQLGAGAGGVIGGLFGGGQKNPSDAASPYLSAIPGQVSPYYSPYIKSGHEALRTLKEQYADLLSNPTAMMSKIGGTYQQSPGYQFQVNQALGAANRAAAAGGMAGTPAEQESIAGTVNQLANQDYQKYLETGLGLYGRGLQGEDTLNEQGFNASNNLAQMIAQALTAQATNAYSGQANQNQARGQQSGMLGAGLGQLASAAGNYFLPGVGG